MRILLLRVLLLQLMLLNVGGGAAALQCPEAFWVFGDSLSDTGNSVAAAPAAKTFMLNPPYGESYTFKDKPGHNRFCDGRLVIDFIAQAFRFPFFGTYQHALNATNYKRGANFAYAGATARADTTLIPFFLQLQLDQFFYFKNVRLAISYRNFLPSANRVQLTLTAESRAVYISVTNNCSRCVEGEGERFISACQIMKERSQGTHKPKSDSFTNGAYIIETGGNDFLFQYRELSASQVIQTIVPQTIAAVKSAIVRLHSSGARLIIVFNTHPQGCSSQLLSLLGNYGVFTKDSMGCLEAYNAVSLAYSAQLNHTIMQLQRSFNDDVQLILFDHYSASIEIMSNAAAYGFNPKTTLQACCGYGGPYNYNPYVNCSNSGFVPPNSKNFVNINTSCSDPQAAIQWDGFHLTQACYRQITKFFLAGKFV